MAFDAHKNFAYSTIATAPSPAASGTSLVVFAGDGAKFPAASFNATIWPANTQPTTANAEVVRVTVIATDTFTITRAQESSAARTIIVGDQIAATVTAKSLTDIEALSPPNPGTSGAVPYYNSTTTIASSGLLTANDLVKGGGAGAAPAPWGTQAANTFLAGPTNGAAAIVTQRALDPLDLESGIVANVTTQFDKTDATLANITGLSVTLVAGKTYHIQARIKTALDATGGYKFGFGGTATATACRVDAVGFIFAAGTPIIASGTSLATTFNGTGPTYVNFQIDIYIVVNAGGTLTVQFAQSSANATSSVLVGSHLLNY